MHLLQTENGLGYVLFSNKQVY